MVRLVVERVGLASTLDDSTIGNVIVGAVVGRAVVRVRMGAALSDNESWRVVVRLVVVRVGLASALNDSTIGNAYVIVVAVTDRVVVRVALGAALSDSES